MTPYLPNGEITPDPLTWVRKGMKWGYVGEFVVDLETNELYTSEELARLLTALCAVLPDEPSIEFTSVELTPKRFTVKK